MKPTAGLPFLLDEGMEVAFVPPVTDCPRTARVLSIRSIDDEAAEVKFDSVTDSDTAHQLVGSHCLARRADLDEELLNASPVTWQGWTVEDEEFGLLGEVSGFVENPGQSLLEIARANGKKDPLLIPAVDEFIIDVNPEDGVIVVSVPAGLLDL